MCAVGALKAFHGLAVQNPHDVLGSGDRRDGGREGKNHLFEGRVIELGRISAGDTCPAMGGRDGSPASLMRRLYWLIKQKGISRGN